MTRPVNYLTNSLTGLEGEPGIFYNYILAGNGLFIQAKNTHMAATVCIASVEVRGLAPLEESIQLLHGRIPLYFLNLALSVLCAKPYIEQYLAVTWEGEYKVRIPNQSQTSGSVTYEALENTVLDIHSHTGDMPARFSSIDDRDEQSFLIYAVVAGLDELFPIVELRLGIYGYFMPIEKEEVFV